MIADAIISVAFMVFQLILILGLEGVHFCKELHIMLVIRAASGTIFYCKQRPKFLSAGNLATSLNGGEASDSSFDGVSDGVSEKTAETE